MDCEILIKGGILLPMTPGLPVIENGVVLIKDNIIFDVGTTEQFKSATAETTIDAAGKMIMPGLVNCHTHLPMSMFRGLADDLPLDVWLNAHIFPAEAKQVNPESVEKWSLHSCYEMLLSGTTCCCDGYFHEENVVSAMIKSGIRAVAGQGVIDFPAPGVPDPSLNVDSAVKFVKKVKDLKAKVMPSIFCHSPYTCSKETLVRAKKAANELGVLFQIHVAETKNEARMIQGLDGRTIVKYLDDIDVLDKNTLMVHCVWVNEKDLEIMARAGAAVAHCPESNMKLASGVAPVPDMIKKGIRAGLGTDGCASNNDHDLMAEMDMAAKLHKVIKMDPCVMDARTVLKTATVDGAKAIGLSEKIGTIEKGKCADIILVDTDKPHMIPLFDPYSAVVYSAKASDVSLVLVDGEILVDQGRIVI